MKAKEITETKVSDNGILEKSTLEDKIIQMENEIKQVEVEFHKRIGKLELLKEMLSEEWRKKRNIQLEYLTDGIHLLHRY